MISGYEKLIMKNNQSIVDKEKLKMKNWEEKKVEDCLDKSRFSVGKIKTAEVKETGNFPVIDQSQNYIAGYSNKKEYLYDGKLPVIIYGDHTNNVKHIDFRFIQGADGIKILVPNEKIDSRYFFYALNLYKPESKGYRRHYSILRKIKIKFPNSLPEQRRIVSKLDALFAEIDASLALIDQNIEQAEALKLSVLDEEFSDKLENEDLVKLKKLDKIQAGGTPKRSEKKYWNGDINWFSSGELNEKYISKSKEFINQLAIDESSAKLFPENTLLIGMYDTAALKMSIITEKAACNQAVVGINPKETFISEFLYYQLNYLRPNIMRLRRGVRQKNLNVKIIRNIEIYLPSVKDQQKIVQKLDSLFEEIDGLISDYQQKRENLEALKSSLLDRAFKGEL